MYWKFAITLCKHYLCWKSIYDKVFRQVTHKGGQSAISCNKISHNAQDLSVSVENSDVEDQMIHPFMDNFHQGGNYYAQIASQNAELRREEKVTDQKYLSILSLHTDYLNLDSSSGCGRNI